MAPIDESKDSAPQLIKLGRNRFLLLIIGVVLITLALVMIAMGIYNSSGAAQLDLSGPRYAKVQKEVKEEKNVASFPASGELNKEAFNTFKQMYSERMNAVKAINGFDAATVQNDAFSPNRAGNN